MSGLTKLSAAQIKELAKLSKKKYRDESGLFLAEGFKILEEIIEANIETLAIYALEGTDTSKISREVTKIPENIMKKISTTESACEILTVGKKRKYDISEFANLRKVALFDRTADPGNLGTIIRSAAAFGIDGIVLFGNCTDLYSPKVMRSSAGNFFKIPIAQTKSIDEIKKIFKGHKKISAAPGKESTMETGKSLGAVSEKFLIMSGSEADGLCPELLDIADENIRIDMKNNVESLNLAVCASIIFYEFRYL